jgi:hypothetical protein
VTLTVFLLILWLAFVANFGTAFIGAVMLWPRHREFPLTKYIGEHLVALMVQAFCLIMASAYIPRPRPTGYRIWTALAVGCVSITSIRLVRFMITMAKEK